MPPFCLKQRVEVTARRFLGSEHGFTIRRTGDFEKGQIYFAFVI